MSASVSIVVPVYRGKSFIGEALNSVRSQTYKFWELIVIEDGIDERNSSERIVAKFSRNNTDHVVRYIQNAKRMGPAYSRNIGIRKAQGRYIAFLDADDVWKRTHLEDAIEILKKRKTDLVYSPVIYFGANATRLEDLYGPTGSELKSFPKSLYYKNYIQPSSCVLKSDVFLRVGLFNPNLQFAEDWDYWIRMLKKGLRISFTSKASCFYRKHAHSLTCDETSYMDAQIYIAIKHIDWKIMPYHKKVERIALLIHQALRKKILFLWRNLKRIVLK